MDKKERLEARARELARENELLTDLSTHPGWPIFKERLERAEKAFWERMSAHLQGGQIPCEIHLKAWIMFFRKARELVERPDQITKIFDKAAQRAYDAKFEEGDIS